ncbi:MAG: hypothetical protein DWI29_00550 [Planctomycetota bacterium]|nr:MAG: hypothetical protein DWI29_00550 [Planctomycetota bacterium]
MCNFQRSHESYVLQFTTKANCRRTNLQARLCFSHAQECLQVAIERRETARPVNIFEESRARNQSLDSRPLSAGLIAILLGSCESCACKGQK